MQRVYERAGLAALIDEVVVATDDERIFNAVKGFGGKVVMTSPEHRSGTDRVAEAAGSFPEAAVIVNIQGDEPLIESGAIDKAIRPLLDDPALEVATLKTPITDEEEYLDPHAVKVVTDREGYALYFSRSPMPYGLKDFSGSADAQKKAFKHIGLYVYRRDFLLRFSRWKQTRLEAAERLEQLRALENGVRIKVIETACNPVSVDTPEDLEKVRAIMAATLK